MSTRPGADGTRLRLALRLVLIVAALALLHQLGQWLQSDFQHSLGSWLARWGAVAYSLGFALYILLLSLPFVPGVELGWALMMMLGMPGVALVYLATVLALALSFVVGSRVPLVHVARLLAWLHLYRAAALLPQLEPLDAEQRLRLLLARAPRRIVPVLLRHRYLALAVSFNLPGNTLLGGGGGIALLAGLSRLFTLPYYLLTVMWAVAPVPLLITLWHGFSG